MQTSFKKGVNTWFEFHGRDLAIAPAQGESVSVFGLIDPDTNPSKLNGENKKPSDFPNGVYIAEDITELTGISDLPKSIFLYLESSGSGNCTLLITE